MVLPSRLTVPEKKNVWLLDNMISSRPERGPPEANSSGGVSSEDVNWSYGVSSIQGKRYTMEDFYEAQITAVGSSTVGLFGVFDGHGGSAAAEYVRKNLFKNLIAHPQFISDTKSAIIETYQRTDSEYLNGENGTYKDAGSTASTVILLSDGRLFVANVGDSRVVISKAGKAIPMSTDHKPNSSKERQRIEKAGGAIIWAGTWRVSGILAVSRAFGDRSLKRFVVADPDLKEETINDDHEFMVLASDGLWDVITNQDAISMIHSIPSAEDAAKRLTDEALRRGSVDNITCIVIRFHRSAI